MTIEAKIIEDSVSPTSPRLTTFQLKYPRFIHAEFMTHRVFSRNASSSRAIPVQKQIDMIREDTAMPAHWGKNQSGMQAEEENDAYLTIGVDPVSYTAREAWGKARDNAIQVAQGFHDAGYHKQVVNRILEPFSHISVVCTATDYDNFFWLRRHKDAQPEIKILADAMHTAMEESEPKLLGEKDWHLPYVTEADRQKVFGLEAAGSTQDPVDPWTGMLIKISVARCARVSYLTHDGLTPDIHKDISLYDRLVGSSPLHASPAEHQARPDVFNDAHGWQNPNLHGNLRGYQQYRKMLPGEHYTGPKEV